VMPLFHIHGLVAGLLAPLSVGGSVIATPGFHLAEVLDWMRLLRASWYTAVPTMHQGILTRARDVGAGDLALRLIRSSSASLPPVVLEGLEEVFGVPVIEAYGMTEAAHQICSNPLPPGRRLAGSVGPPAGPEVRVVDVDGAPQPPGETGEVVIRGTNVTSGYVANPEANAEAFRDGWFRTGDQGWLDAEGALTLTGRLKEIINRGGEKVSPREVDEVLLEHPDVAQAVTFAVPDPVLGEAVAAAVVVREGTSPSVHELRSWVAGRVASFKVPAGVVLLDEIPTGPTGKLQRIGLAERLGIHGPGDLPRDDVDGASAAREAVTTDDEVVARLQALWSELLGREHVAADDDFLALGGDSMTAARLLARVRSELAAEVDPLRFFDAETVGAQARLVIAARVRGRDV
jgi:oxalate---CoA ligase